MTTETVPLSEEVIARLNALSTNQIGLMQRETAYVDLVGQSAVFASIGLIAGMAVIAGLMSSFRARQITQPLSNLSEATRELAAGRLKDDLSVTTDDELGSLTHAFNQMRAALQKSEAALKESYDALAIEHDRAICNPDNRAKTVFRSSAICLTSPESIIASMAESIFRAIGSTFLLSITRALLFPSVWATSSTHHCDSFRSARSGSSPARRSWSSTSVQSWLRLWSLAIAGWMSSTHAARRSSRNSRRPSATQPLSPARERWIPMRACSAASTPGAC